MLDKLKSYLDVNLEKYFELNLRKKFIKRKFHAMVLCMEQGRFGQVNMNLPEDFHKSPSTMIMILFILVASYNTENQNT